MLSNHKHAGYMLYDAYIVACHQMPQRSYCVFNDSPLHIADCSQKGFNIIKTDEDVRPREVLNPKTNTVGYEFGVCARCTWFYISLIFGILAYVYVYGKDSDENPNIWLLILAIIPLAIDGTGQLLGFWTSTNNMRMVTGALSGFFGGYFIMPIVNRIGNRITTKEDKRKTKGV